MMSEKALARYPRWRLPKKVAPDAWLYYTEKGIEVYHDGNLVCVIPQRMVALYAKQRAALR